jgi:hypothetical protein
MGSMPADGALKRLGEELLYSSTSGMIEVLGTTVTRRNSGQENSNPNPLLAKSWHAPR